MEKCHLRHFSITFSKGNSLEIPFYSRLFFFPVSGSFWLPRMWGCPPGVPDRYPLRPHECPSFLIELSNDARRDYHEKSHCSAGRGIDFNSWGPGGGGGGAVRTADGKGDRHHPVCQGRARQVGAGQCHQGHDHAADHGGHRLRAVDLRHCDHGLRPRLLHGREPDLAKGKRTDDSVRHAEGCVRRLRQRLRRGSGGADCRQRGGLRGAHEPAGQGAGHE